MKTSGERLAWALTTCQQLQVRMTPVRSAILTYLSEQRTPVGLVQIAEAQGVKHRCNGTTVYRTLMMFKEANLARLVGTVGKTAQYVLNFPEDSSHFLICDRCGAVVELEIPSNTQAAIRRLAIEHGFSGKGEHLEVQGLCQRCANSGLKSGTTSKLMARYWPAKPQNHSTDLLRSNS